MPTQPSPASHLLLDPCAFESSITFTPQGATVVVSETIHPDIPESVRTLPVEEARALYLRCRNVLGMITLDEARADR